jgi:hypothetical protein
VLISKDNGTVAAYPRTTPKTVIGMRILATRFFILKSRKRSSVNPNTQPTCGRALKTIIIEIRNPKAVNAEAL